MEFWATCGFLDNYENITFSIADLIFIVWFGFGAIHFFFRPFNVYYKLISFFPHNQTNVIGKYRTFHKKKNIILISSTFETSLNIQNFCGLD